MRPSPRRAGLSHDPGAEDYTSMKTALRSAASTRNAARDNLILVKSLRWVPPAANTDRGQYRQAARTADPDARLAAFGGDFAGRPDYTVEITVAALR
jgi:hypothetical protein